MKSQATRNSVIEARRQRNWTLLSAPFAIACVILAAFALVSMITPAQAADEVETYRVAADTFYCPDRQSVLDATRQIRSEDFKGYVKTMKAGNCQAAPEGYIVVVTDIDGDASRGLMRDDNSQVVTGYFLTPLLTPAPDLMPTQSATVLTQVAFMCRRAIDAELYMSRLDIGDIQGARMLIQENGCARIAPGEMVTVTGEPNTKVYAVEAPVGGQIISGFIPRALVR